MKEQLHSSDFDPKLVANYETQWWIAHNEKNKEALVENLVKQHQELFHLPAGSAQDAIHFYSQAVRMHDQRNWSAAVEFATDYYQLIKTHCPFSVSSRQLAQAEVTWWKKHDELEFAEDKTDLTEAFAALYSCLFSIGLNDMRAIAQQKTAAINEHDLAEKSGVTQEQAALHWQRVEEHLTAFYTQVKSKM